MASFSMNAWTLELSASNCETGRSSPGGGEGVDLSAAMCGPVVVGRTFSVARSLWRRR